MAQKLQEAQGVGRTLEITLPIMQIKPEVADNWNWDRTTQFLAEVNSVPAPLLNTPDEVAQIREARMQQMQQAQAAQQAAEVAKAAGPLGKEPGPNSPLGAIMDTLKGTAQAAMPSSLGGPTEGNA